MNDLEAIELRHSRRAYLDSPIPAESIRHIDEYIEKLNRLSGLSIQFIKNGREAFQGFNITYGMFSGVQNYFALVGKLSEKDLSEKAGYYGELLVLEATKLGLGTCWVAGTYNKNNCPCTIQKDETLVCIITVGNVAEKKSFKENAIYRLAHRGTKAINDLYTSDTQVPDWFLNGMKAVQKAPSAVNKQPVYFRSVNGIITAEVSNMNSHQSIDLGIAKAHFEIGAGGKFEFGNGAAFTKE